MSDYYYCTLFNYNYISRGLTLYDSICKTHSDFTIYIFPFDELTEELLRKLNLKYAVIIGLKEFEDKELLEIKTKRTFVEYCWTCTPSIIKFAIEKYNLNTCTYLDADICFYKSPESVFKELSTFSVGISPHNYSKEYDKSKVSGKYCVQFVYFKNDKNGTEALNWWRNECIKWCYSRVEDGKFGDQKYLDHFEAQFDKVRVIENPAAGIAPWNIQKSRFFLENNQLVCKSNNIRFNVIFYHFHMLKIDYKKKTIILKKYEYTDEIIEIIYLPYINNLISYDNIIHNTFNKPEDFRVIFPGVAELIFLKFIRRLGEISLIRRIFNILMEPGK